ncbi:Cullin [Fimicolochytrium jonesii]|uniref:Cullin n=1 Tax=Fimicolochytrium jonesii TaxID=1396493 RepID=UPI0022FEC167|nr:Cullin [Fimicolochytrium jonesii]KAI8821123.1 Cullin [Fimicolochytrium jonesii]
MSLRPKRVEFDATFSKFRDEISNMFAFTNVGGQLSGMFMIQTVYDLCTAHPKPHTDLLYQAIGEFIHGHACSVLEVIDAQDDVVSAYATAWERYRVASQYLNIICDYLNKLVVKMRTPYGAPRRAGHDSKFPRMSVEALAFHIWKDKVYFGLQTHFGNRLVSQLLDMIHRDRDGFEISLASAYYCISSLALLNHHTAKPLQLYIEQFEKPYIEQTKIYYAQESSRFLTQMSIASYMVKANERLSEEDTRCKRLLDPTSNDKVVRQCDHEFIEVHQTELLAEVVPMLSAARINDAKLLHSLLSRVDGGIPALLDIFRDVIVKAAVETTTALSQTLAKDPRVYAENLMDIHAKYMRMCAEVFNDDPKFTAAVDQAFRVITNDTKITPGTNAPELLARYCDVLLKKSAKGLTEDEVEKRLGQMIVLFKYIDDKDVFQKFYSRMLAKRLIHGTSISDEAESNMITRLKIACGVEFTTKLQRMFTDTALSADLNTAFSQFAATTGIKAGVDMQIMVLTAGSWPLSGTSATEFVLPSELEKSITQFTNYYAKHFTGRKLTWLHHLARADVKLNNFDKRYELALTLYQTGVLLLFNNVTKLTVAEIKEQIKLGDADVGRIVKGFVDLKLLLYDETTASYTINDKFTNKRIKIKVSAAAQSDTPQEVNATREAVDNDRKLYLQAAIVRIMKSRKELSHTHLLQEVIDQAKARFAPSVPVIKKCIEQLIEKQYIDRVPDTRDRYMYIS